MGDFSSPETRRVIDSAIFLEQCVACVKLLKNSLKYENHFYINSLVVHFNNIHIFVNWQDIFEVKFYSKALFFREINSH